MSTTTTVETNIRQTALDYIEGWFKGDAQRMARCLHPELAKRTLSHDPDTGESVLRSLTRERMVELTRQGGGTDVPPDDVYYHIDILDHGHDMAVVRVDSYGFLDHLHMVRQPNGQWVIVNILFINRPTQD